MNKKVIIYFILALVILGIGSYFGNKARVGRNINNNNNRQAVFLTNGQVYFGYLSDADKPIMKLKNVYYVQQDQGIQSGIKVDGDISIIKLGGELQGPDDEMFINKDHVLFFENMLKGSKVNKAIESYVSGSTSTNSIKTTPTPNTTTPAPATNPK